MPEIVPRITGRLIFGILIIALGVLFTLDNLGMVQAGAVLRYWHVLLIAYGLARLTGFYCRQNVTAGVLFTLAGGWLLLHEMGFVRYDFWDLWPLVLVFIGFSMVSGSMRVGAWRRKDGGYFVGGSLRDRMGAESSASGASGAAAGTTGGGDPSSTISAFAIWSNTDRKVVSQDFRGGDVTAIMGGHDIDLRAAKMASGPATLELFVVMGGVDLRIPEDWKVSCEALPFMGSVEDHSKPPAGEAKGHLILRGLVIMGGVEVKN